MGRAPLEVGEIGSVTAKNITVKGGPRRFRATGRVRITDTQVDQIKAVAGTADAAKAKVRAEARTRMRFAKAETLTRDTTFADLVEMTLDRLREGDVLMPVRPQTIDQYDTVTGILRGTYAGGKYPGAIGSVPLRQVTKQDVRRWLRDVSVVSTGAGRRCKAVAIRAFDLAIDEGVDPWNGNPATGAPVMRAEKRAPKSLTPAEVGELRERVRVWQTPNKRTDLLGLVDMLIATGMRPGELFALRWEDVDLTATPATVTVTGTVVELKGSADKGGGVVRQPFGKTDAAFRIIALPTWAAGQLMDKWVNRDNELVFPNDRGGLLNKHNIGNRWRDAIGADFKGVQLYDFRRTVATMLARDVSDAAAASQLGHSSPTITHRHYIERAADAGDYTRVLDALAP